MTLGTVTIVGAGIVGRYVAWRLAIHGASVTLIDRQDGNIKDACSMAAAGLLTPFSEAAQGEPWLVEAGMAAMSGWQRDAGALGSSIRLQARGSLAVARAGDSALLEEHVSRLQRFARHIDVEPLDKMAIEFYCPGLSDSVTFACRIPGEGMVDNVALLSRLDQLLAESGVQRRYGVTVTELGPHFVITDEPGRWESEIVIDCRGLGARHDLGDLRGVRGEIIELHAPEFSLNVPMRVQHPQHAIYLVPRADGNVLVGATMIETEDAGPISVRSSLELLSTAYALHPALRHARVVGTRVGCRPAFFDHRPRITVDEGLMRINGMYRHGFLLAPWVADKALARLEAR